MPRYRSWTPCLICSGRVYDGGKCEVEGSRPGYHENYLRESVKAQWRTWESVPKGVLF